MSESQGYSIERSQLTSRYLEVGNPVPYTLLLPPDYSESRAEPYPLLLYLHGGGGNADELLAFKSVFEVIPGPWGELAEFVILSFSCVGKQAENTVGGQYLDYADGSQQWGRFVVEELLPHMIRHYHLGNDEEAKIVTMGISMGGAGALRLGFRYPERFTAIAAIEPHIHAGLSYSQLSAHQRALETPHEAAPLDNTAANWSGSVCGSIRDEAYGKPVDESHWQSWQPACMVVKDAGRLREAGLQIYLECGDCDEFEFNFATEYLHRLLLEHGIEHDYHLLRGVTHCGGDLGRRVLYATEFLSRQVLPKRMDAPEEKLSGERCAYDAFHRKKAAGYLDETTAEKYRNLPLDWRKS